MKRHCTVRRRLSKGTHLAISLALIPCVPNSVKISMVTMSENAQPKTKILAITLVLYHDQSRNWSLNLTDGILCNDFSGSSHKSGESLIKDSCVNWLGRVGITACFSGSRLVVLHGQTLRLLTQWDETSWFPGVAFV